MRWSRFDVSIRSTLNFSGARYRGIELEALLDLPNKELVKLFPAR